MEGWRMIIEKEGKLHDDKRGGKKTKTKTWDGMGWEGDQIRSKNRMNLSLKNGDPTIPTPRMVIKIIIHHHVSSTSFPRSC